MHMRVAVKNHALPVFKKTRIALLLCIFETIIHQIVIIIGIIIGLDTVCTDKAN